MTFTTRGVQDSKRLDPCSRVLWASRSGCPSQPYLDNMFLCPHAAWTSHRPVGWGAKGPQTAQGGGGGWFWFSWAPDPWPRLGVASVGLRYGALWKMGWGYSPQPSLHPLALHVRRSPGAWGAKPGVFCTPVLSHVDPQGGILALRAHCALLLDYVPPEEPPGTPLGNAL